MLIQHIGHAEFLIETGSGMRIVTDPYDESCGYPVRKIRADVALVSHHHHDHDAVNLLEGNPRVIDTAGEYTLETGIRLTAVTGDHDDAQGAKRGKTLHFLLEAEGLRVVHLGDLGCALTEENARILKHPDILMIPVGGFYTISAALARETADRLEAGTILPMHYRTKFNANWPISGPEDFLALFGKEEIRRDGEALRITRGDRECQPKVFLFKQEG